jgi:hypothetical protein
MRRITRLVSIALLAIFIVVGVFGCYGNMSLTKKVYHFNGSVGNKFVQSIVNCAFWVCPVYEAAMFMDIVFFNTIEFWTGNNPISMNEGEKVIKYAEGKNGEYKLEISQNKIVVTELANNNIMELNYEPATESWFMNSNGTKQKIGYTDGQQIILLSPSGEELSLNMN